MKDLKELSKWRDAPRPRAGRLNIVKMPLPPNLICGFCTISTQIPVGPFADGQTDPTVPAERQRPIAASTESKENEVRELRLMTSKTH